MEHGLPRVSENNMSRSGKGVAGVVGLAVVVLGVMVLWHVCILDRSYRHAEAYLTLKLLQQDPSVPLAGVRAEFPGTGWVQESSKVPPFPPDRLQRYRTALDIVKQHRVTSTPYLVDARIRLQLGKNQQSGPEVCNTSIEVYWLAAGLDVADTRITVCDDRGTEIERVAHPNLQKIVADKEWRKDRATDFMKSCIVPGFSFTSSMTVVEENAADWQRFCSGAITNAPSNEPSFVVPVSERAAEIRLAICGMLTGESNPVSLSVRKIALYMMAGAGSRDALEQFAARDAGDPGADTMITQLLSLGQLVDFGPGSKPAYYAPDGSETELAETLRQWLHENDKSVTWDAALKRWRVPKATLSTQ
jgi:hypothetical protein